MTPEKLRAIYGDPGPHAATKAISRFDGHCRDFIAHSPFLLLATSDGTDLDLSPKGDPAGFVRVVDDTSLLIPDRPGNNRIDAMMNILAQPKVALLFMIPSVAETLRLTGTAEILDDPDLCDSFQINGRSPKTVLRITADQIFIHCGKAPMRAGLWDAKTWPAQRPVASMYEMLRDHTKLDVASVSQSYAETRYRKTLY